jgi:hypothetical protein
MESAGAPLVYEAFDESVLEDGAQSGERELCYLFC